MMRNYKKSSARPFLLPILFSSHLFIFHISQPYIRTGFTSVLYSLTLVSSTDAVAAPNLFQPREYPSRFDYSVLDVLHLSTLTFSPTLSALWASLSVLV